MQNRREGRSVVGLLDPEETRRTVAKTGAPSLEVEAIVALAQKILEMRKQGHPQTFAVVVFAEVEEQGVRIHTCALGTNDVGAKTALGIADHMLNRQRPTAPSEAVN